MCLLGGRDSVAMTPEALCPGRAPTLTGKSKQLPSESALHIWFEEKSLVAQMVKNLPAMQETRVQSLGWEEPLEKGMATQSSILAWRIPWTVEPGELWSIKSQKAGHDWVTNTFTFLKRMFIQWCSVFVNSKRWSVMTCKACFNYLVRTHSQTHNTSIPSL